MLNFLARDSFSKGIAPVGRKLADLGVTPNTITVVGTVGSIAGALVFFTQGWWFAGTLIVWAFVMADLLDGAVARAGGTTSPFGGVLDSTCDRAVDAAVFGSILWFYAEHDQRWIVLACLLCLVFGSITSYIRSRAEAAGMQATVGIAERAERLIIVLVGTGLTGDPFGVPFVQAVALWLLVAASAVTVAQRLATVYRQSRDRQREAASA